MKLKFLVIFHSFSIFFLSANFVQADPVCVTVKGTLSCKATSGYVFTRVTSFPALGEAWKDESGITWGDVPKDDRGITLGFMKQQGINYCARIGARIPNEIEIRRLIHFMGVKFQNGGHDYIRYQPEVLPNMITHNTIWVTPVSPNSPGDEIGFSPDGGYLSNIGHGSIAELRCVMGEARSGN